MSGIDCEAETRKRVCKACDRCRIKKSKCDGKKPCSRCRHDDAICVFGGRKRKTDRVHPKGYVEILERQQRQLVRGIRAMYDRHLSGKCWDGPFPDNGHPSTHEILDFLGALDMETSDDDDEEREQFEDSLRQLRTAMSRKGSAEEDYSPRRAASLSLQHSQLADCHNESMVESALHSGRQGQIGDPRESPESLTYSETSLSASDDARHWSGPDWLETRQGILTEGLEIPKTDNLAKRNDPLLGFLVHETFNDPFLSPPWDFGGSA